jgi:hypothetical protein
VPVCVVPQETVAVPDDTAAQVVMLVEFVYPLTIMMSPVTGFVLTAQLLNPLVGSKLATKQEPRRLGDDDTAPGNKVVLAATVVLEATESCAEISATDSKQKIEAANIFRMIITVASSQPNLPHRLRFR